MLKATNSISDQEFDAFFNQQLAMFDRDEMKKYGYFLYQQDQPAAFFSLLPVDRNSYWLRTLVMKQHVSKLLPITIFESAESLTHNFGASSLIVHSKTTILNELLTQLGYQQTEQVLDESLDASWWITTVSNVDKKHSYSHE
ncbi:hypothetical protein [Gracilibacillus salinarum]|uniref:GNAT family N-acetyltransferase n=1 Tax=Gracilibacillus salinarum TaxID=2932255 RepID=A0ABY4GRR1_9BACI|nr:hypothetical protein [Gracilibacillus salinarum]UOQ87088.1 hypothetical protein MUN87_09490 [Gracilibacillus salinarum]